LNVPQEVVTRPDEIFTQSVSDTACLLDIHLYLNPMAQAGQFIEACGT
jgi:hypothetical protein